jgi:hypothetical protein
MKMTLAGAMFAGLVLALAASTGTVLARGYDAAQEAASIGVDADPTGNTATSLGPIDPCRSVSNGDTFEVDVFVADVADLLAWETYFVYDMSVINIVGRDVVMFQAANAGSNVFDVSEGLPDIDGRYGVAAVDLADPPAPDSGSGVLARLTLRAVGPGVSPLSLSSIDINSDGRIDLGPTLKDIEAEPIGDVDGDEFFDGPIAIAEVVVGGPCPGVTPVASPTVVAASPTPEPSPAPTETPTATAVTSPTVAASPTATAPAASPTASGPTDGGETSDDDGPPWVIVYVGIAVAAVLLVGAVLLGIRRLRAR